MIDQAIESITKFLKFNDMKLEEDYNAYFQLDIKRKYRIFIYIDCVYIMGYIITDILKYFYSEEQYLAQQSWLFIRIGGLFIVFLLFLALSVLIIINKLSSIRNIDIIVFIMGILIQFAFNNPFLINNDDNACTNDKGYSDYWEGYSVQYHNIFICNLFNKWIYKLLYFCATSAYFYFYKHQTADDQIIGIKLLGFIITFGIMVYYFEKVNRLNYLKFRKLIEKEKMWKDITDSLPEGVLVVNKDSKPLYINNIIKSYLNRIENNRKETENLQQVKKEKEQLRQQKQPKKIDNTHDIGSFFDKVINLKLRNSLEDLRERYKKFLCIYKKLPRTGSGPITKDIPDFIIDQEVNKYHPIIESSSLNELMKFTNEIDDSQYIFSMDDFITFDSSFQEKSLEIKAKNIKFDGEVVLLMIFVDTTHRDLIAKLEQNDKYKNIVLSTVSHELRTPLNSAISMIQTAIDSNNIPELDKNELLDLSLRSLNMLASLINDILDYSQIQANKLNLVFQNVDIRQVVYDACLLFDIQCKKKNIELLVDIEEEVPTCIRTDPNRLTQIILNLLSNAIKFTKKGYVQISVKWDDFKYSKATISVEDTGIGIKSGEISKLFQEFGKIDLGENAKMNPTGCGLGLSISHKLAMRLGRGDSNGIKVQSEVGKGSIFSFTIEDKQDRRATITPESILNSNIRSDNSNIPKKILKRSAMSLNPDTNSSSTLLTLSKKFRRKNMNRIDLFQDINNSFELDEGSRKNLLNTRPMKFLKSFDIMDYRNSPKTTNRSLLLGTSQIINCCDHSNILSNKPRLLIIDDDTVNLYSLTLITKYLDYECDTVHSVEEGFKLLQKENLCRTHAPYDIIFMDFNMPDIDGLTATKTIKNMILKKELPSICIVGCTAFLNEKIKAKGIESGMDYILEKPVTKHKLFSIVNMLKKDI